MTEEINHNYSNNNNNTNNNTMNKLDFASLL